MNMKNEAKQLKERANRLGMAKSRELPPFPEWLEETSPELTWDWPYLEFIISHLEAMTAGSIKRLIITVPPRHGKSSLVTERYAAYRIVKDPATKVIIGSYGQDLSERFSSTVRGIVSNTTQLKKSRKTLTDWQTTAGGGVRAAGMGTGVTGMGADLLIIDDPVKSRADAESESLRQKTEDWYTNVLYTRLEPEADIILIMTRWHIDDLAGRILSSTTADDWTVINLPAIAEENDPLGRSPGEALCPDRYPLPALNKTKQTLGLADFQALYQGQPTHREGQLFKRGWFPIVDSGPEIARYIRYWDKAGTAGRGSYTAGVLVARTPDGVFYILDVLRRQLSVAEREKTIKRTAEEDKRSYSSVSVWIEQEPGSAGKESAQATIKNLAGFNVKAERVTGSKVLRAGFLASQAEAGNVKLLKAPWNEEYLDEVELFPSGKYSDQVDATTGAVNKKVSNYEEFVNNQFEEDSPEEEMSIPQKFDAAIASELNVWIDD